MLEHLAALVDHFPGAANQTRCFTHILNLAAKSILRQFDAPKKNHTANSDDLDEAANVLTELTRELELDEVAEPEEDDDDNGDDGDKEDDEQHNECDGMSEAEVLELAASLVPVRLMLAKVISN